MTAISRPHRAPEFPALSFRSIISMLVLAAMCLAIALLAEVGIAAEPRGAGPGVMVLTDGRVQTGAIRDVPGGYFIQVETGGFAVPFEQVKVVADDLESAYEKQDELLRDPTSDDHLKLARWCTTHQLFDAAREQLRFCLSMQPDRADARRLLLQIDQYLASLKAQAAKKSSRSSLSDDPGSSRDGLGGLSQQASADYVRRIQPLLINKCGNGACHGTLSDNDFHLLHVRAGRGSHRLQTEQNLASIITRIDHDKPDLSDLIMLPQQPHGGEGRPIFRGPQADEQLAELRRWIRQVASEVASTEVAPTPEPEIQFTSAEEPSMRPAEPTIVEPALRPSIAGHEPARGDILERVRRESQPDAFDPQQFNRMIHGRSPVR